MGVKFYLKDIFVTLSSCLFWHFFRITSWNHKFGGSEWLMVVGGSWRVKFCLTKFPNASQETMFVSDCYEMSISASKHYILKIVKIMFLRFVSSFHCCRLCFSVRVPACLLCLTGVTRLGFIVYTGNMKLDKGQTVCWMSKLWNFAHISVATTQG